MIPIPVQLFPTRFTLRTMLVGIAAAASIVTLFSQIVRPPEQAAFALLLGIILPTLWVGAWRQFTLDRLLAQVMAVSIIDLLLVEPTGGGSVDLHAGGRTVSLLPFGRVVRDLSDGSWCRKGEAASIALLIRDQARARGWAGRGIVCDCQRGGTLSERSAGR